VLIQVWRTYISGERFAFRTVGGQQKNLGVSPFDFRRKDRGNGCAVDGFPEDNIAVGEVKLRIFLRDFQIADPIARRGIEARGQDGLPSSAAEGGPAKSTVASAARAVKRSRSI